MDPYVDIFMVETHMCSKHIIKILEILETKTDKKVFVSMYPLNGFDQKQVKEIMDKKFKCITGLFVNCCELEDMNKFFTECIYTQDLSNITHLGFYCNKIDQEKY